MSKRFGTVEALEGVSLTIRPGQVHALVGRNGSGKSTLVKVLSGYHRADTGSFFGPDGQRWDDPAPFSERMAFIHQDLALLERLSVLDNLLLGLGYRLRFGRIDWRRERRRAAELLDRFGLADELDTPVAQISQAEAVVVAVARAVGRADEGGVGLLVLDEPTSSLPRSEIGLLFSRVETLRAEGAGILVVTHKLEEVFEIADAVTVLRNGRVALSANTDEIDSDALISAMLGQAADAGVRAHTRKATRRAEPRLRLSGVRSRSLAGIDLDVADGEVLGVVGLLGSGLSELAEIASQRRAPDAGTVEITGDGTVALVPGDRVKRGILADLAVRENLNLGRLSKLVRRGRIDTRLERESTAEWLRRLAVEPADPQALITSLSGGNQQKVVMGRALSQQPSVLVVEGPTQGVDVGAKLEILSELRRAADEGMAVLIISYEYDEILDTCDRVAVLAQGEVADVFPAKGESRDRITRMLL